MKRILILILLAHTYNLLQAQTTYNFTGNGNWSNEANWQDNQKPPAVILPNTTITINPTVAGQCVVDIPVTIPPTCILNVAPGAQMNVMGNLTILNAPENRRVLLVQAIFIDTLETSLNVYDTLQRNNYYYDGQNRVVKIDQININGMDGTNSSSTSDSFCYFGNDTLAYRKIRKKFNLVAGTTSIDTFDYTYHISGKRLMDSLHNGPRVLVNKCVYVGDSLRVSGVYSNTGYYETNNWKIYQQWSNGIMVSQRDTMIGVREGYVTRKYSETLVTSYYPDKQNPFYIPGSASRRDFYIDALGINTDNVPAKLIKQQTGLFKYSFNNAPFEDYPAKLTYDYVFRDDGYPSIAWERYEPYPVNQRINFKIIFVYNQ